MSCLSQNNFTSQETFPNHFSQLLIECFRSFDQMDKHLKCPKFVVAMIDTQYQLIPKISFTNCNTKTNLNDILTLYTTSALPR